MCIQHANTTRIFFEFFQGVFLMVSSLRYAYIVVSYSKLALSCCIEGLYGDTIINITFLKLSFGVVRTKRNESMV